MDLDREEQGYVIVHCDESGEESVNSEEQNAAWVFVQQEGGSFTSPSSSSSSRSSSSSSSSLSRSSRSRIETNNWDIFTRRLLKVAHFRKLSAELSCIRSLPDNPRRWAKLSIFARLAALLALRAATYLHCTLTDRNIVAMIQGLRSTERHTRMVAMQRRNAQWLRVCRELFARHCEGWGVPPHTFRGLLCLRAGCHRQEESVPVSDECVVTNRSAIGPSQARADTGCHTAGSVGIVASRGVCI
mmetsp:Transcript_62459/g.150250  ORF Transcript_62459/g.150250 Transcript_62459/m.150250 type:complete len:244 (-) Transcript_62459:23-754(-)